MQIKSKLPQTGTTIFTVMSALAQQHGAINLSQGFPNYSSSPRLIELVCKYMREGYNQYPPMAGVGALRRALSDKMRRTFDVAVDPETEITITAGATQALFTAIMALVHAGDEVIVIEPAFDSYLPAIKLAGGIPVAYEMGPPKYRVDWEEVGRLVTPRTRMIIINSPHNPTGTVLEKADMEALEALVADTGIWVLSDEVYEHLIYDGREHQSVLRYPALRPRSLAVFSFGKTFHNTGWKVGYCVASPEATVEFRKVHQFNVFTVNTPVQHGLAEFLREPGEYLGLPAFYQKKRDFFLEAMAGSRLRPLVCEGTYFHLFDYRTISQEPDQAFARRMTTEYGVAAIPVSVFYGSGRDEGIIRLCFAKTEDVLAAAGEKLRAI